MKKTQIHSNMYVFKQICFFFDNNVFIDKWISFELTIESFVIHERVSTETRPILMGNVLSSLSSV